jgi:hypothetical protein
MFFIMHSENQKECGRERYIGHCNIKQISEMVWQRLGVWKLKGCR